LDSRKIPAQSSLYDLFDLKLIVAQVGEILNNKNLSNISEAAISVSKNIVNIQTERLNISNKVNALDTSKEGLVPKDVINVIKQNVDIVTNILIESSINKNKSNPEIFYETNTFTVQIENTSLSLDSNINRQIKKGLSLIDVGKCANSLRSYYNFKQDVIIQKIDYNPKLESKSGIGDVSIKFYSPIDGSTLNFEEICVQDNYLIKFPLKDTPINKDLYEHYILDNFNPYDSKSEFYNNRCKPLVNTTSGGDITINERIQRIYQNFSISCGGDCLFSEIEINNFYTVCKCRKKDNPRAFVESVVFSNYTLFNIDIIVCIENISRVKLFFF